MLHSVEYYFGKAGPYEHAAKVVMLGFFLFSNYLFSANLKYGFLWRRWHKEIVAQNNSNKDLLNMECYYCFYSYY